jgi:hypothetical protein
MIMMMGSIHPVGIGASSVVDCALFVKIRKKQKVGGLRAPKRKSVHSWRG